VNTLIYDGTFEEISFKECIATTLQDMLKEDEQVVYLDADLMSSMGTNNLPTLFPEQVFNCGIQEANMIGVAAGMSSEGKIPYVHTFGAFAGRRCFDQVFLSIGYAKNSVRIIGSDPGVQALYNGGTHQPFEDVALYRVIPQSAIYEPCDAVQMEWALRSTKNREGVTYLRSSRKNQKKVYAPNSSFKEGEAIELTKGKDVVIFATGMMVAVALEASVLLSHIGIRAKVVDLVTIKPLDEKTIIKCAKETNCVVTCENSLIKGGVYSAVCEVLGGAYPTPVEYVGLDERFGEVGDLDYLTKTFGLTAEVIKQKAQKVIERKRGNA
jgi:transketolase